MYVRQFVVLRYMYVKIKILLKKKIKKNKKLRATKKIAASKNQNHRVIIGDYDQRFGLHLRVSHVKCKEVHSFCSSTCRSI